MRGVDFGIGVPLGLIAFYGLSLASALWIAPVPDLYVWGLLLSAIVCCLLGLMLALRAPSAVVASGTMLVVAIIGYAVGSDIYLSVPPFPVNVLPLMFHGARSAVVTGPLVLVGTAAIGRTVSTARRRRADQGDRQFVSPR